MIDRTDLAVQLSELVLAERERYRDAENHAHARAEDPNHHGLA